MSGRKFFVGGNWKMNGSKASIDEIIKFLNEKGVNPKTGRAFCETLSVVGPYFRNHCLSLATLIAVAADLDLG